MDNMTHSPYDKRFEMHTFSAVKLETSNNKAQANTQANTSICDLRQ